MLKKTWLQNRIFLNKSFKIYCLIFFFVLVLSFIYFSYSVPSTAENNLQATLNTNNKFIYEEYKQFTAKVPTFKGERIVHLDLKGAPPKVHYYAKLFPLLSRLGATGVLIEYEDMFPYSGPILPNISALNSYHSEDINTINMLAAENNLEVIPLLQTFGHLEFILKLEEYKDLREVYEYPQVICPTHEKTIPLLVDMIDQVMSAHPNSKRLHIGADEVYNIGLCDRCLSVMSKNSLSKKMLFLEHINAIISHIQNKYPNLEILMWDDEFRAFSSKELKEGYLNKALLPVVWKYTTDVYDDLGPSLWTMYASVFPKLWIASAFKGATGSNQYISDVTHYVQNHRSWMSLVHEYKNRINFEGIIITGWQRYDHFAVLCELLPVSLPSLAMSLRIIMGYNDSPLSPPTEVAKMLGCEQPYALMGPALGSPKCSYPGGEILEGVLHLQQLKQEFELIMEDSRVKGWLSDYNIENTFSSPQHIQSVTTPLSNIKMELGVLDSELSGALYEIYDNYTVNEWRDTYIRPFQRQVDALWEARNKVLSKTSWPRRPLQETND